MIKSEFIRLMDLTVIPLLSCCEHKFIGGTLEIWRSEDKQAHGAHSVPTRLFTDSGGASWRRLGERAPGLVALL